MAKHVILEAYTFTPSTKTIVVTGKWIRKEQLLLITNTDTGTVLYNFSDPTLGATVTNSFWSGNEVTNIVVSYDTTAMSASAKLAIIVEETYESLLPAESLMDPVGKMRVSTPQSLIDTDFEYGQQPTKWETIATVNNRPTAFYDTSSAGSQFIHSVGLAYQARESLMTAVALTAQTATLTANATVNTIAVLSAISSTAGMMPGMPIKIHGTGAPGTLGQNAIISSVDSTTQVTIQTTTPNISGTASNVINISCGGITSNGNSFTVYHNNAVQHPVGSFVQIVGGNLAAYNGQWQVGSSAAGQFTVYTTANPGYMMGSSGTGALFTLASTAGVLTGATATTAGSGYRIGDRILVTGGAGAGGFLTVATLTGTGIATVTVATGDGGTGYTNGATGIGTAANGATYGATATVTGVGTVFHTGMIGSRFVFADGTDSGVVTAVASTTSLTVSTQNLVSTTTGVPYTIYGFPYKNGGTPNTKEDQTILTYAAGDGTTTNPNTQYICSLTVNTGVNNLSVGQPIFVTGSNDQANVDGWWVINSITANNSVSGDVITFKVINVPTTTSLFDPTKTQIFPGSWYTQSSIPVTSITGASAVATVVCPNPHGLTLGQQIHVMGTTGSLANAYNGTFVISAVPSNTSFSYYATGGASAAALTLNGGTYNTIYPRAQGYVIHRPYDGGVQFANQAPYHGLLLARQTRRYFRYQSGKGIQFSTGSMLKPSIMVDRITNTSGGTTATVYCKQPHGIVANSSTKVTNPTIRISNAIDYPITSFAGTATMSGTTIQGYRTNFSANMVGQAFYFADGTYGGIISSVNVTAQQMTSSATLTYATASKYYLQSATYNGTFTVLTTPTPYTFTYTMNQVNPNTGSLLAYNMPGTQGIFATPMTWYGGKNRVGLFDNQNGFFFEYDGTTLYAVRRSSTQQIDGTVQVTRGSQTVTGNNTLFSDQLKPGDQIVIRGGTYTVNVITSDTAMLIYPEYRGATPASAALVSGALPGTMSSGLTQQWGVQVSKIVETRVPQSQWNIDKCDGTGASGYNIDLSKMQMFYIDYSWYGAGAIRFGVKNNRGEVIYAHRIVNNNQNTESYMRSGNIAARYETNTYAPTTYVTNTNSVLSATSTTGLFYAADIAGFPPKGIIAVSTASSGGAVEFMSYDNSAFGGTSTGFNVTSRGLQADAAVIIAGATGGGALGTAFTLSNTAPIKVELFAPSLASTISHWGSSIIMDGRYDDDKSLVFSSGMNNPLIVNQRQQYPLISVRIAPSVDSGSTSYMGAREIINRMQLLLRQMDAQTRGAAFAVDLWLNAAVATGYVLNATGTTIGGSTLNLTGTLVGAAPALGSMVYGPNIPAGTYFSVYTNTTTNTMSTTNNSAVLALATGGGTYWFSNAAYQPVGGSSLAQRYLHASTDRLVPGTGEKIFTFFSHDGGVTQQDLTFVRDLATSIIGGASTNHVPVAPTLKYPDGPDTLTMVATPIGSITSGSIIARLSWTEAQA